MGGGPEFPEKPGQTLPVAMFRRGDILCGVIADSPARWENRCQVLLDQGSRELAVHTGDGASAYSLRIRYDANTSYEYKMDGWQSLGAGETRRYRTWVFASTARSIYQSQLAAHLAFANAQGWNHSAVEAILRNTSYFLLRRNLMRDEGRYIFISGIGYGWKQWVSDGFWTALGLSDPEFLSEACRSVFPARMTYEDNAQYYLIWALQKN